MSENKKRKYHVTKCYFLYILADFNETASCEYMEEVSYLSLRDKYVFPHFARKRFTPTQNATLVRLASSFPVFKSQVDKWMPPLQWSKPNGTWALGTREPMCK